MDPEAIAQELHKSIQKALPQATVKVTLGSAGHYSLDVCCASFEGKNTLARQRAVYAAIAPWMAGNNAPVHAIDQMITSTPG